MKPVAALRQALLVAGLSCPAAWGAAARCAELPSLRSCIEAAVAHALHERWGGAGQLTDVRLDELPVATQSLVPAPIEAEARLAKGLKPRSRVPVTVHLRGRRTTSLTVWVGLSLWGTVQRTRTGLSRNAELQSHHTEGATVDLATLEDLPYQPGAQPVRLRVALPAGAVVLWRHVAVRPLVARGDRVRLNYRQGGIEIDIEVVAAGGASLGEPVAVRAPGSLQTLQAVVVGPGEVRPR